MFTMGVSVRVYDYGPVTRCAACVTFEMMKRNRKLMSLTLGVSLPVDGAIYSTAAP